MNELKQSQNALVNRIGLIGTGMIGTSILLSLRLRRHQFKAIGFDTNQDCLDEAHRRVNFEICADSPTQVFENSDLVIIATPPQSMNDLLSQVQDFREDIVITDVASNKHSISEVVKNTLGEKCNQFVPGHPIAGSELNGPKSSSGQMFNMCKVILTPFAQNSHSVIQTVVDLWYCAGVASVVQMSDKAHDHIVAYSSHLPHILAYALVHSLGNSLPTQDISEYSAGGLRDFSRIAGSNPDLWCDILMSNANQIQEALQSFNVSLDRMCNILRESDRAAMKEFLQHAVDIQSQIKKD